MRTVAMGMAAVLALASPASAQEVPPGTPGDAMEALYRTHAFLCDMGDRPFVVSFRVTDGETLEALGDMAGWQVVKSDRRITLNHNDAFLQLDGPNSLGVSGGELRQGSCVDVTYEIFSLLATALGGDPGDAITSLETSLIGRAEAAEEQVHALEAETAVLRRQQTSCGPQAAQLLDWIARDLPRLGEPDVPAGERQALARTMGTRVATLQRLCGDG